MKLKLQIESVYCLFLIVPSQFTVVFIISAAANVLLSRWKQQLGLDISMLPGEILAEVVRVVKDLEPSLRGSNDVLETDLDSINPATLRVLDSYMTSYFEKKYGKRLCEYSIAAAQFDYSSYL